MKSLILSLKSSSSRFIMLETRFIFMELSLSTSLIALTSFFAFFTMLQLFCRSLVTVWITISWLNVVNQVFCWCPRVRSNFNWITTRHIPSIDASYHWIPNDNDVVFHFRLMSFRMQIFKTSLKLFKSVILWNLWLILFLSFCKALFVLV